MNNTLVKKLEEQLISALLYKLNSKLDIESIDQIDFINEDCTQIVEVLKNLNINGLPMNIEYLKIGLEEYGLSSKIDELKKIELTYELDTYIEKVKKLSNERNFFFEFEKILKGTSKNDIEKAKEKFNYLYKKYAPKKNSIKFVRKRARDIIDEKANFFIKEFLPIEEYEVNLISGDGGIGKSKLCIYLLLLIAKIEKKKCLGWFTEDSEGEIKSRINNLSKIFGFDPDSIEVMSRNQRPGYFTEKKYGQLSYTNFFEEFKEEFKDCDVLLLDPASAFQGADENSNVDVKFFMDGLNSFCIENKITLILIHHHTKPIGKQKSTIRGAGSFSQASRIHYIIRSGENNTLDAYMEKVNNMKKSQKPYNFKVFESEERIKQNEEKEIISKKNSCKNNTFNIKIEKNDDVLSEQELATIENLKKQGVKFDS